jgi:hypothetical protein
VASEIAQYALGEVGRGDKRANDLSTSSAISGAAVVTKVGLIAVLLQQNVFHRALLLLRLLEGYRAHEVAVLLRLPSNTIQSGLLEALLSLTTVFNGTTTDEHRKTPSSGPRPGRVIWEKQSTRNQCEAATTV